MRPFRSKTTSIKDRVWLFQFGLLSSALIAAGCVLLAFPLLQRTSGDRDIATVMPPGAMVYLESRDFADQLRQWNESAVKQSWLESENFSQFEKSRLYLRLKDKLQEFSSLAGLGIDFPLVRSLAGNQAGLALYDIRDIEFVFATRIPGAEFEQGPFFQQRPQFEQKSAEGGAYFSRSAQSATIAFAVRGSYFFLATSESLLRSTLHNVAVATSQERLSAEPLFQESQAAMSRTSDIWMYLNMGLVQRSRYFRNEWIYRNFEETSRYRAGIVRLSMETNQYREERQFLLKDDVSLPEQIDAALLEAAPRQMELVRGESAGAREIAESIYSMILDPLRSRDATLSLTASESPYEIAPLLKSDNRYFLQIDEPLPPSQDVQASRRLEQERLIGQLEREVEALGTRAYVQCDGPRPDTQGYIRLQRALLLGGGDRNLSSLKQVIQSQYNRLYLSGNPAAWTRQEGAVEVLGARGGVTLASKGSLLILSNSESFTRSLLNSPSDPAAKTDRPLHSYARLDLKRFRSSYDALFRWLDYEARPRNPGEAPPYFSQNLGSLMAALSPVEGVTVQSWGRGKVLHEEIIYQMR